MTDKRLNYFSFENTDFLEADQVIDFLTEEFVLKEETKLFHNKIDCSNIYFKLLAQLHYLENKNDTNPSVLSYLNYLIGFYVGLFLNPFCEYEIALYYINKAISLENDKTQIEKYKTTISMIKEGMGIED